MDVIVPMQAIVVFCLGLVHVKNIHALFGLGYHVPNVLLLDHAHVHLRKKSIRVNGVCFVVEGGDTIGGKISTQHMRW
jgi:hypothetical protein